MLVLYRYLIENGNQEILFDSGLAFKTIEECMIHYKRYNEERFQYIQHILTLTNSNTLLNVKKHAKNYKNCNKRKFSEI